MSFKFNPLTGKLDLVSTTAGGGSSADNFSYERIVTTVTIPVNQQMAVHGDLEIDGGELILNGTLVLAE